MRENIVSKIKKYLFMISMLFFVIIWTHLTYLYLYDNAEEVPIEWGTISEAIIGNTPHLNPLLPSSDYNKYINSILYRSLLTYDSVNQKIESDLTSCDINSLVFIECYLESNIAWSNGDPITADDIIATFNLIEKTNINPGISALLENTVIEKGNGKITFNNIKKDINFLNIFFQPIIPKSVIDNLSENEMEWSFSPIGGIYSGRYILSSVNQDETVGITKMTLTKNDNYFQNDTFIKTLIFKVFRDNNHFLKHKNSVNILNDKDNIIGNSIPRLKNFSYALPQFVGLFLNQETLDDQEIREKILWSVSRDTIESSIGESKVAEAINPFLSETNIDTDVSWEFKDLIKNKWYLSKQTLLDSSVRLSSLTDESWTISDEANIKQTNQQESLKYISSPTNQKYNFISEDNVLLKWNVDTWVTWVYVNDYLLQGFSSGDEVFYYRLLETYDTIVEWTNTYNIYFEKDGKTEFVESIVYTYYSDEQKLRDEQEAFEKQQNTSSESSEKASEIPKINETDIKLDISSIENLDNRFLYDTNGDVFKLRLVYVNSDETIETSAQSIKKQLEALWVFVELIPLSLVDITRWLRDDSLVYDGILIGINLWYFDSNIFPYFHSSQVVNGYNFSNYKQLGLDILLEELKSNNLTNTKKSELESKVLDILKESSIIKVLYSPKTNLLVDQNLQWFTLSESIPDEIHRFDPVINSYMTKKKILEIREKSFSGFWRFIFTSFL